MSLYERYAAAGFGRAVSRGQRPAVVVVDFTCGFTVPSFDTGADMTSAVTHTAALAETARRQQLPVIFTAISFDSSAEGSAWRQKAPGLSALRSGSEEVNIDPRLRRLPDELLVIKHGASAFFGTDLASALVAERVDTLIVCGATTSGCVRATVVDAVQFGFPVLVPRECVADRADAPHEANLFDIEQKYGDVISVTEAQQYLATAATRVVGHAPSNPSQGGS